MTPILYLFLLQASPLLQFPRINLASCALVPTSRGVSPLLMGQPPSWTLSSSTGLTVTGPSCCPTPYRLTRCPGKCAVWCPIRCTTPPCLRWMEWDELRGRSLTLSLQLQVIMYTYRTTGCVCGSYILRNLNLESTLWVWLTRGWIVEIKSWTF